MSTKAHIRADKNGDPVLTITVTGYSDIYRLGEVFTRQQTDFVHIAQRSMRYLYRKLGRAKFKYIDDMLNNGRMLEHGWHRMKRRDF